MAHIERNRSVPRIFLLLLVFVLLVFSMGCGRGGLVSESYSPEFYRVPKLLPDSPIERNPRFIVYGDSRPGWRLKEAFLWRKNWLTWKMLIFPFYEAFWLGNGVVGGVDWLRQYPGYGLRERRMVRDAIYTEAVQSKVDFVLHSGDMVTNGKWPEDWAIFLKENKEELPLVSDFPFLPVIGSHEKVNDPKYGQTNYEAVFAYPRLYVLDFPDVALFVVDSNLILDGDDFIDDDEQDSLFQKWFVSDGDSAQPSWLEQELASRRQHFKILAMHHPPVSFAKHHPDWSNRSWGRDLRQKRQKFLKLLHKYGVQVLLCGHEHLYERSIVRFPSSAGRAGHDIHVIVSGGGGVPLRSGSDAGKVEKFLQNYSAEGLDVMLIKQEEVYHYCVVDVASDKIVIKVMAVTEDPAQSRLVEEVLIPK
jgi:hypothetical protein